MENEVIIQGKKVVSMSATRVKDHEKDPDLHYYDVRHHDDDQLVAVTVEPYVLVNFLGTISTEEALDLGTEGFYSLSEDESDEITNTI
ncbi:MULTISPECIES: LPD28 domain-containing protein [unclassified Psychrobacillus]|uniref:LPD28 domain-containing protein n=1 Tax=unclassified Psychrobacillus TaxID=2636677 RepID=UPI0030F4E07F